MKREEKNMQTQRRILDSALAEFARQGYGASSVNTISSAEGLSKGIIYHYFETKDELYLACVEECFQALTCYIQENIEFKDETAAMQLEVYFNTRLVFFQKNPVYQRIFCGAVITPPSHLAEAIAERKAPFDEQNVRILKKILGPADLRPDILVEEVIEIFRQYQDFINARYEMTGAVQTNFHDHEKSCKKALDVLLHGIIARKEPVL